MKKKSKSWKREGLEWGIFLVVIAVLYATGLHKEVIGGVQRIALQTGLFDPDLDEKAEPASYDFMLRDIDGETVHFGQFEGRTVFLNFWATWCPPCIAEMPDIEKLYNEMKDQNVEFVMVNLDDDFDKAKSFVEKKNYTFPVYRLGSGLPAVYRSQSIPTTFVVSPDGKIALKHQGMADYHTDEFKAFLKKLSS